MKSFSKLAIIGMALAVLAGCTGTTYNEDRSCSTDYLLIPAISIPNAIGACDNTNK
ncbi:YhfL family protein [Vibrio sp.]|uniref:DUF4223 domain-containing protein n=1 Tax=Vibrio viridaestus TaxID=2487322 RepID=A0A3N9THG4_9VIBR|nr:DUF4223 family protein [Vibrio viridaestus]MDC0609588.1 YhfL family protein [Vibrio sp.]RQW63304.1 DUF4223 domain-containing protein [Vibrio viridaestus]